MALALYSEPNEDSAFSTDGSLPFTLTFMGRIGGAIARKIYIRNDDLTRYYTNIVITPTSIVHSWKLLESDNEPSLEQWDRAISGQALSLSDSIGSSSQGDAAIYLSFWVQVSIPPEQAATNLTDTKLQISATEGLVV